MQANIIGGPVDGKVALMFDDMISTAGSISGAANVLHENGAKEIHVGVTHAVLCGNAMNNLREANLASLICTNSIPQRADQMPPQHAGAERRPAPGRSDQAHPPQRIGERAVQVRRHAPQRGDARKVQAAERRSGRCYDKPPADTGLRNPLEDRHLGVRWPWQFESVPTRSYCICISVAFAILV